MSSLTSHIEQLKPFITSEATGRENKAKVVEEYTTYHNTKQANPNLDKEQGKEKLSVYVTSTKYFYDLVTDFYEWGWGQSFHFAPRYLEETFEASLARHEYYLALRAGLKKGMKVLDVGCGVGGPLRAISRFSKAHVTGVNYNDYQIERAKKLTRFPELNAYVKGDFNELSKIFPENHFDAVYQMEATCHCLNKARVYGEIYKVLKPGGNFVSMEWVMTDKYDETNPVHVEVKNAIAQGNSIDDLPSYKRVVEALNEVGFEIWDQEDVALDADIPWYNALQGNWSLTGFARSTIGRFFTNRALVVLERLKVVPAGTTEVSNFLNSGADALVKGGQLGIVTPCFFTAARKPEKKN